MKYTLKEILAEASKDKRVCPRPHHWNRIWGILLNRKQKGGAGKPPVPLILGAWWDSSNEEKRKRFHEHIRWAERHGALSIIGDLIFSLAPEDWHTED
jgi:hypothetical protein